MPTPWAWIYKQFSANLFSYHLNSHSTRSSGCVATFFLISVYMVRVDQRIYGCEYLFVHLEMQHVCLCLCVCSRGWMQGAVRTNDLGGYHKAIWRREPGVEATNLSLFHPHQHLLFATHTHTHTHTAKTVPGPHIKDRNREHDLDPDCDNSCSHYSSPSVLVLVVLTELQRAFPWPNSSQTGFTQYCWIDCWNQYGYQCSPGSVPVLRGFCKRAKILFKIKTFCLNLCSAELDFLWSRYNWRLRVSKNVMFELKVEQCPDVLFNKKKELNYT